jgi:SAM-dependent methyltransferase
MDRKEIVKRQFDAQAKSFSNWSVTRNEEYMQAYFEFIGLDRGDTLLDVACGTGEFSVFCARRIKGVHGIDISEGMIDLARKQAHANGLTNLTFECHDVEHIPRADSSFRSHNAGRVSPEGIHGVREMPRCQARWAAGVQDAIAFELKVNSFFEALEREVDVSHNATLHRQEFIDLFDRKQVEVIRSFVVEVELNFREYLSHAVQSESSLGKIRDLLEGGLQDRDISRFLYIKEDNELVIKRAVFLILGQEREE